ncbi:MAG: hypothetical protein HY347_04525 [candidate division NC10 bacterium]|nr:hypothetical protein [candidate division NC10 bacterium]
MDRCIALFLPVVSLLLVIGAFACQPRRVYEPLPLPPRTSFQVEGAGALVIELVKIEKRPLAAQELIPGTAQGVRWEYTLRFKGASKGVTISRLKMTIIGHLGEIKSEERPFSFHLDPGDEADLTFTPVLSTSLKDRPEPLAGVHQLLLEGKEDQGNDLRISIRVPLE